MVTFHVTEMITTSSPLKICHFLDSVIVASTEKRVVMMTHQKEKRASEEIGEENFIFGTNPQAIALSLSCLSSIKLYRYNGAEKLPKLLA